MINVGDEILRDFKSRKFVHACCIKVLSYVHRAHEQNLEASPSAVPAGLTAASSNAYKTEWSTYVNWVLAQQRDVPGKDVPWDASLLWQYLQFRSQKCKASTLVSILSMLAHFGPETGFVLPNSKYDGNPELRRSLERMKKQLRLDAALEKEEDNVERDVGRATPLDQGSVELLLSAFQIFDEDAFLRRSREDRHNVMLSAVQYTAGVRFGHFLARQFTEASFRKRPNGSYHLVSDWSRYPSARRYCLDFLAVPRYSCQLFRVRRTDGSIGATLTAATLLKWHFRQLRADNETSLFRPVASKEPTRGARQRWLRNTLWAALPLHEKEARDLVGLVSPHSFRAGLAGDLHRHGTSFSRIGAICRWSSPAAIRIYATRPSLSMARKTRAFRVLPHSG